MSTKIGSSDSSRGKEDQEARSPPRSRLREVHIARQREKRRQEQIALKAIAKNQESIDRWLGAIESEHPRPFLDPISNRHFYFAAFETGVDESAEPSTYVISAPTIQHALWCVIDNLVPSPEELKQLTLNETWSRLEDCVDALETIGTAIAHQKLKKPLPSAEFGIGLRRLEHGLKTDSSLIIA
jgi:hypothetical protein